MMKKFLLLILSFLVATMFFAFFAKEKSKLELMDYTFEQIPLTLQLPKTTYVIENYISGSEILFSSFLQDKKYGYWGYIQLWDIADLEDFLKTSKSQSNYKFASYNSIKIGLKNYNGFRIYWTAKFKNNRNVIGKEYFLRNKNDKPILRISFFTDELNQNQFDQLTKQIMLSLK